MNFKVIKIRSCSQCGDVLSKKCDRCVDHPHRVARVQYCYEIPPAKSVGPCGCVLIQCQYAKCIEGPDGGRKWFWRTPIKATQYGGKFCRNKCAVICTNESRDKKTEVVCSNNLCDRGVEGKPKKFKANQARLKEHKHVYCAPVCDYVHRKILAIEAADARLVARKAELEADALKQMLWCRRHRDATVHVPIKGSKMFQCSEMLRGVGPCLNISTAEMKVNDGRERFVSKVK